MTFLPFIYIRVFWLDIKRRENEVSGYTCLMVLPNSSPSFRPLSYFRLPRDFKETELVCARVVQQNWAVVEVSLPHINDISPPSFGGCISVLPVMREPHKIVNQMDSSTSLPISLFPLFEAETVRRW